MLFHHKCSTNYQTHFLLFWISFELLLPFWISLSPLQLRGTRGGACGNADVCSFSSGFPRVFFSSFGASRLVNPPEIRAKQCVWIDHLIWSIYSASTSKLLRLTFLMTSILVSTHSATLWLLLSTTKKTAVFNQNSHPVRPRPHHQVYLNRNLECCIEITRNLHSYSQTTNFMCCSHFHVIWFCYNCEWIGRYQELTVLQVLWFWDLLQVQLWNVYNADEQSGNERNWAMNWLFM